MKWAIETLKEKTKEEIHVQKSIDSNIHRERNKIKEELLELNRFIIKQENAGWILMTKEDALAEKDRLEKELAKCRENPTSQQ